MRIYIFLLAVSVICGTQASNVPNQTEVTGKFSFNMLDGSGEFKLGNYIKSPSEVVSATGCMLRLSADDDYYNSYPIEINLFTVRGETSSYISAKAEYIDENSKYWNKNIQTASFAVGKAVADNQSWVQETVKGTYILYSPNLNVGLSMVHEITMGQPLKVDLIKQGKPSKVTINVPPLNAKTASIVRKCMKLLDTTS